MVMGDPGRQGLCENLTNVRSEVSFLEWPDDLEGFVLKGYGVMQRSIIRHRRTGIPPSQNRTMRANLRLRAVTVTFQGCCTYQDDFPYVKQSLFSFYMYRSDS
ncbi:hypothetical protein ZEAMMB73_Zm00001d039342 [Zea mays]|uniref:Uncharacterized protein n=1 Tax=Zea mays TaxID=4577 RepID=A0A1D6MFS5_MAIZE|nr:hypothetical protein ZEAMMB73_Zm00001d039342 [Zea mays]